MNLSNEIKIIRQKTFMTQEQFAKKFNVAVSTVNRWENGKTVPGMKAMKQMKEFCNRHNLPFDDLEKAWIEQTQNENK